MVELASEIASPRALFFWPATHPVRWAESTDVPLARDVWRAIVNALGRRFEVGTGPSRFFFTPDRGQPL